MVKKLLLTIITFIYLMMSSGIAMEVHYCMGKKLGVEFYSTARSKCSRCGMKEKKGGCCHDEHKFVKLSNEHKNITADNVFKAPPVNIAAPVFNYTDFLPSVPVISFHCNASPDIPKPGICILHCVFRI